MSDDVPMQAPEDWPLASLGVFSSDQLEALGGCSIQTLGQLLGATSGLVTVPPTLENAEVVFQKLAELFPTEVRRYREDDEPFPPTGLLTDETTAEGGDQDGNS